MAILILGLIVFFASHSAGILAPAWREAMVLKVGKMPFMALSGVLSLVGLAIIVWGVALARQEPVVLREPSLASRHLAIGLNLLAFLLLGLFAVPAGRLKAWLGHPLILAIIVWAVAHLIANGTLADLVLFGSFLVWGLADLWRALQTDRSVGRVRIAGPWINDVTALAVGLAVYLAVLLYLHGVLIGREPLA